MATKGRSGRLLRRTQEPEDFELVEPAHVIRLRFQGDEDVSYGDEEVHFHEVAQDDPPEEPSRWHPRAHEYRPRRASTYDQIESEIDRLDRLKGRAPSDDLDAVHRAVDLLTKDVRAEEERVLREEVTEYVPKEETDRSAAAKKAAATRKKNQAAKEASAKKAAAARKRKAAAKKAAETRKRNKEAREAAALKAAETRKKNLAAKEKAAKEAAEARKRKAAAKKAAETRRRNAEAARKAEEAALAAKQAAGAKAGSKEYRPQCGAVTSAGLQCRNSARSGSKYCGSHKGYRPGSLDAALERTDTHPRAKKAEDTLPTKGTVASKDDQRPQCGAWTASNKQCRNSARSGSKYCASHKGYNPRSALKAMDTQPRWKKAEDTKPSLRS